MIHKHPTLPNHGQLFALQQYWPNDLLKLMQPSILHLFEVLLEDRKSHIMVQMLPSSSKKPFMQLVNAVPVDQGLHLLQE